MSDQRDYIVLAEGVLVNAAVVMEVISLQIYS